MDKCPIVELGVHDTHLREKKKKDKLWSISFPSKSFKVQERYVSPQKSKRRIRLSPLFSLLTSLSTKYNHQINKERDPNATNTQTWGFI